jgi:hypothetical protein
MTSSGTGVLFFALLYADVYTVGFGLIRILSFLPLLLLIPVKRACRAFWLFVFSLGHVPLFFVFFPFCFGELSIR